MPPAERSASARVVESSELDDLRPLIESNAYLPSRFLNGDAAALCLEETRAAINTGDAVAFASAAGAVVCSHLPWESSILGYRMTSVRHLFVDPSADGARSADALVERALWWAQTRNAEFVHAKVHSDDYASIHAYERHGFSLVETALDYVYDCRETSGEIAGNGSFSIRMAREDDVDATVAAAGAAFAAHIGRFHSDPRLSPAEGSRLYEQWLRSSFAGYADAIFVAEVDGAIAGFSVWRNPTPRELAAGMRCAHYSIGGVHPRFRGRGIFRALTSAGMTEFRNRADFIEGPTNLLNLSTQRAFQALRWTLRDSRYTFHRWL